MTAFVLAFFPDGTTFAEGFILCYQKKAIVLILSRQFAIVAKSLEKNAPAKANNK
jgi:hypothetical protein